MAQNNALIKRDFRWREIYEVLAAGMRKLITACARKNKRTARMLKDHSIEVVISALELYCMVYYNTVKVVAV